MKIAVCSDLHLEFGTIVLENPGVEVLVLSGDILVDVDLDMHDRRQEEMGFARRRSQLFHNFFQDVSAKFPHVIYVAGNHEHYHGDFKFTLQNLKRKLEYLPNVHVLDKETFKLGDYVFFGATLWTDMNKSDPMTLHSISKMMNDFRCVNNSDRVVSFRADVLRDKPTGMTDDEFLALPTSERFKSVFKTRVARFSPEDAVTEHNTTLNVIRNEYDKMEPWETMVVCGHHTPSHVSMHPRYAGDREMNGGYHSDLSEFILDRPAIKLWTHGHTHEAYDYMIGDTRVVCNPRGYAGHEEISERFTLKVVEV
jgi:predicted phosphodiesterase